MDIYEQIASNKAYTWMAIMYFVLLFVIMGLGFDYFFVGAGAGIPVFTLVALVISGIWSVAAFSQGDRFVLFSTHARPLDLSDPAQLQWSNTIEEMSIAAGIPVPKAYIIDDLDPNAFATGMSPDRSSIAVTRGLLNLLNRDELQGVASHEMSHIKNYDIRLMLIIAVLAGAISLVADWARRGFYSSGRRSRNDNNGSGMVIFIIWLCTVILAPLVTQVMALFVSRKREYLADASGAELTRNPMALAAALGKIDSMAEPTRSIHRGTAHLCICDPQGHPLGKKLGFAADLFATHPPIQKRIELLRQMAYLEK